MPCGRWGRLRDRILVASVGFWAGIIATSVEAAVEYRTGVDAVSFAWDEASGEPDGYLVSVSRNDATPLRESFSTTPSVTIPVVPGERIAVSVQAFRYEPNGTFSVGPESVLSDQLVILAAPQFDAGGSWLLYCWTCAGLERRPVARADTVATSVTVPAPPWWPIGRADLGPGGEHLVWRNLATGEFDVWDANSLEPVPGGRASGPVDARFGGAADVDGDGRDELFWQDLSAGRVEVWGWEQGRLVREATWPAAYNALLEAVVDLTGDGVAELVWFDRYGNRRRITAWELDGLDGPRSGFVITAGFDSAWTLPDVADYDGDGDPDLLLERAGGLWVAFLRAGRAEAYRALPASPGDEDRQVVGSMDLLGGPGVEIVLQDPTSSEIQVLLPEVMDAPARVSVLHPGPAWQVIDVQPF